MSVFDGVSPIREIVILVPDKSVLVVYRSRLYVELIFLQKTSKLAPQFLHSILSTLLDGLRKGSFRYFAVGALSL